MALDYVLEKLAGAVRALASRDELLRDRLRHAAIHDISQIHVEDISDPGYRDRFKALKRDLTSVPAIADEGSFAATIDNLTGDEATNIVERICDLYRDLQRPA